MNNTVYNFTATHKTLVETLISLYSHVEDPNTSISWWTVLQVLRQLEKDSKQHEQVVQHYRDYYADTHWTIVAVLDSTKKAITEIREQEEDLRIKVQCYLGGDKTVREEELHVLATALLHSARGLVHIEKYLLSKMLKMLAPAKKLSVNADPDLKLVGA